MVVVTPRGLAATYCTCKQCTNPLLTNPSCSSHIATAALRANYAGALGAPGGGAAGGGGGGSLVRRGGGGGSGECSLLLLVSRADNLPLVLGWVHTLGRSVGGWVGPWAAGLVDWQRAGEVGRELTTCNRAS